MTITYNLGIPATNDSPTTDQPNMLINNDNNAAMWAIDHVAFNSSSPPNSGMHNQVTFAQVQTPSTPATGQAILYTSTLNSQPNLLFLNPISSSSNTPNTASGSVMLMGGIILKWGVINFTSASKAVTYSQAFPNNVWALSFSANTTTPLSGVISFSSSSTAGFTAYCNFGGTITGYYIAIGN